MDEATWKGLGATDGAFDGFMASSVTNEVDYGGTIADNEQYCRLPWKYW